MNDLMSFGIHRLWKRTISLSGVRGAIRIGYCWGPGDLAKVFSKEVGRSGSRVIGHQFSYA